MRPIFSGARRAFAAAVLVTTIASLPGVVIAEPGGTAPVVVTPNRTIYLGPSGVASVELSTLVTEADGDLLTYTITSTNNGTPIVDGSTFKYTPNVQPFPGGSFTYSVTDKDGSTGGTITVVQDLADPTIYDLPDGLVLFAGPSGTLVLPDLTSAVGADDTGEVASITQSPDPGTELPPGSHPITFTVTDGAGNTATGTAWIEVVTSLSVVKAAGDVITSEPGGTTVQRFGVPSINQYGDTAYLGRLTAPGMRSTLAVLAGNPVSVRTRVGDDAVGIPGAKFKFFLDPVLDDDCNLAFIAYVTGEGITRDNDRGVWVHNGQQLRLIAREGDEVPETPGARFSRFTSVSMKNGEVLFLAELVQGVGGIDKTNDVGVWAWDAGNGLRPVVREGGMIQTMSGPKKVTVFSMLRSSGTSRGQGRSHAAPSLYTLWARCEDGSKAILTTLPPFLGEGELSSDFELFAIAETRKPLMSLNEPTSALVPKAIGLPAMNSQLGVAAVMTLASDTAAGVNLQNNQGIFAGLSFLGWTPVVRKGEAATEGTTWRGFKDPIINNNFDVAWLGRLTGAAVDVTNDYAIGYARSAGECIEVIAREGDAVPGVEGAKWSQFLSIALPDGVEFGGPSEGGPFGDVGPANGPIFLARIAPGSSGGAAITSANDVGVWAVDGENQLRLLLREGDTVKVNGVDKKVKSMTLLNTVSGSRDVSRAFNERGEVILRAQFTDNSQAVLTLRMPVREADPRGV